MTPAELCQSCGACCDGTMFRGLFVRAGEALPTGGVAQTQTSCPQPCAAHVGGRCSIYDSRPRACREYECEPLKSLKAGTINETTARAQVRALKEQRMSKDELLQGKFAKKLPQQKFDETVVAAAAETAINAVKLAATDSTGQLAALQRLQRYVVDEVQTAAAESLAARGARARELRAKLAAARPETE